MENVLEFVIKHLWPIEMYVFWYPVCMGLLWVVGGLIYYFKLERKKPMEPDTTPMVSVLVPAFNESENIQFVVEKLCETNYPNYEIIIINDGSSDNSSEIEGILAEENANVRFIDLKENSGKANALYLGLMAAKGEYLMCVDGDSYLDPNCISYMVAHFVNKGGERVGAVTGNPKVRNRSSLLAKIQVCEYASIISMIKRTQRIWGKVMTVSGVCVMYSKKALMDVGLWDRDMVTEDIAVTWKLEKSFWDVRYEPNALCYMLVPETIKGLIRQRKRWAQGGQEVILRHANIFKSWKRRRLVPVYAEQVLSLLWIVNWLLLFLVEIFAFSYNWKSYVPNLWRTQFLSIICLIQFTVAVILEHKYDKHIFKNVIVVAWYPIIFWVINGLVALAALPGSIKSHVKGGLATWVSPDRGIKATPNEEKKIVKTKDNLNECKKKKAKTDDPNTIKVKQKLWKKIIEIIITAVAWIYVLSYLGYVIYGIVCVHMHTDPVTILIYNKGVISETHRLFYISIIIFLIEIVVMIFWKEYNRIKYGKLDRRKAMPDVTVEDISLFYDQPEEVITSMQTENITVLEKNIIPKDFNSDKQRELLQNIKKERMQKKDGCSK